MRLLLFNRPVHLINALLDEMEEAQGVNGAGPGGDGGAGLIRETE